MRVTNEAGGRTVVCVNGGQAAAVPGTWSASVEWLVRHLAPRLPEVAFAEVRYRVKSWQALDRCVEDTRAALRAIGPGPALLLGYSMGGAVSIAAAGEPSVERVVGLAPWIPDRLGLEGLRGRRFDVLHGSLDRWLPGIPGVSPASSRRGFERVRALGVPGTYDVIPGALHAVAVRPRGRLVPLPRAGEWVDRVEALLRPFAAA